MLVGEDLCSVETRLLAVADHNDDVALEERACLQGAERFEDCRDTGGVIASTGSVRYRVVVGR